MQLKYLAHSAFLLTSNQSFAILIDPYEAGDITSNTHDFALWVRALLQQKIILNSNQLKEMETLVCTEKNPKCIPG